MNLLRRERQRDNRIVRAIMMRMNNENASRSKTNEVVIIVGCKRFIIFTTIYRERDTSMKGLEKSLESFYKSNRCNNIDEWKLWMKVYIKTWEIY